MARTAKRLQVRSIVGIAVPLERYDVIALKPTSSATLHAPEAVAIHHLATDSAPSVALYPVVVPAHTKPR